MGPPPGEAEPLEASLGTLLGGCTSGWSYGFCHWQSRGGAPTWQGVCLLVSTSPSGDRVSDNEGSFQPLGLYTRQESKQNPKLSARVTNSSQLAQNFPDFSLPGPPLVLGKPRCLLALFLGTCTDSPHLRRSCTRQICRRGASRIPR